MPKSANQKLKLLYLMDILLERTDEEHGITMQEILDALKAHGVTAERKSIYDDFESLRTYGLDVLMRKENKSYVYYAPNPRFELAELKLLVDSVQAAKFITAKKSNELIKKIEKLASRYEAGKLQRQVFVAERVKTENESIFYNVDILHAAIGENTQISFQYFQWNVKKEAELRRNGERYVVSPWALSWDDEYYYLIAYDSVAAEIRHYRVDKMLKIQTTGEMREGQEAFRAFDPASYTRKSFGMFGGREETVTLLCRNSLAGVIIDRFGRDVFMVPQRGGAGDVTVQGDGQENTQDWFKTKVKVAVSRHFLSWVIALGEGVKVIGPDWVVDEMRDEVRRLQKMYAVDV